MNSQTRVDRKLADLERRVSALENERNERRLERETYRAEKARRREANRLEWRSRVRPLSERRRIDAAREWVLKHLKGCKASVTDDMEKIPRHGALVRDILAAGRAEGFPEPLLRAARTTIDHLVEARHVGGSIKWMWRLRR